MIDNPFGGGIKKAPGLLKVTPITLITTHPSGARPGAKPSATPLGCLWFLK
nr:MAG TPA: hypothetical protein [Caudoviricetes sp.]